MKTKICKTCGEEKLVKDFHKSGKLASGTAAYHADCKVCRSVKQREDRRRKTEDDDFLPRNLKGIKVQIKRTPADETSSEFVKQAVELSAKACPILATGLWGVA